MTNKEIVEVLREEANNHANDKITTGSNYKYIALSAAAEKMLNIAQKERIEEALVIVNDKIKDCNLEIAKNQGIIEGIDYIASKFIQIIVESGETNEIHN